MKAIISIKGMHCASCAYKIENALSKLGVKAKVTFAAEEGEIEWDPKKINLIKIKAAIEKLGYIVSLKKFLDAAISKLDLKIPKLHQESAEAIKSKILKLKGIDNVDFNLATKTFSIFYSPRLILKDEIKNLIEKFGYLATEETELEKERFLRRQEIKSWKLRFLVSLLFGLPLLYSAMGHFIGLPFFLPKEIKPVFEMLLSIPIILIAFKAIYLPGAKTLANLSPNMDSLIFLGTSAAFLYSFIVILFRAFGKIVGEVYFETGSFILIFIFLGKYLESITRGKVSEAVEKLLELKPKIARILIQGKEKEIPIEALKPGDVFIVKPGEIIPADGVVIKGYSSVDEKAITGESLPVEKKTGSKVIGATLNKSGVLYVKATNTGETTVFSQIIKTVEQTLTTKPKVQVIADKIAYYFVPLVLLIAMLTFISWLLFSNLAFALTAAVSVLIIACPCAIGLATPTAIMIGSELAAKNGILIKSARALENLKKVNTVIFDKTGTLTKGEAEVVNVLPAKNFSKRDVIYFASIAEKRSEHPLAKAILKKAFAKIPEPEKFKITPGKGLRAIYRNKEILVGNRALMRQFKIDYSEQEKKLIGLENKGITCMLVALNKEIIGIIGITDKLKLFTKECILELKKIGNEVGIITGDNRRVGEAIAKKLGIEYVLAEVLPAQKAEEIKKLQHLGKVVATVGDGINDAPMLGQADVGIAIGSGTDVAKETGDAVLIKDDLRDVIKAIKIGTYTIRKIKQNLFWAFFYNLAAIPIAAGLIYPIFGVLLNPMIAAAAMAFSSISVVTNSLLMRRAKI